MSGVPRRVVHRLATSVATIKNDLTFTATLHFLLDESKVLQQKKSRQRSLHLSQRGRGVTDRGAMPEKLSEVFQKLQRHRNESEARQYDFRINYPQELRKRKRKKNSGGGGVSMKFTLNWLSSPKKYRN